MTPTLEGTEAAPESPEAKLYLYKVTARPAFAREFTFYVCPVLNGHGKQAFVVSATAAHLNWFSRHRTPEAAVRSANYRARRYNRAYSKPRNILPAQAVKAA